MPLTSVEIRGYTSAEDLSQCWLQICTCITGDGDGNVAFFFTIVKKIKIRNPSCAHMKYLSLHGKKIIVFISP